MNYQKRLLSNGSLQVHSLINFYDARVKYSDFEDGVLKVKTDHYKTGSNGWVCWGNLVNYLSSNRIYKEIKIKIIISTDPNALINSNRKHFCFFSKEEVTKYLERVSREYGPFEFSLVEGEYKYGNREFSCFYLEITLNDVTKKRTLWILNLVRHIYEFPFNVMLRDALIFEQTRKLKNQHLTNLLQMVATIVAGISIKNGDHRTKCIYPSGQCLGPIYKKLRRLKTVNEHLSNLHNSTISEIYDTAKTIQDIEEKLFLPRYVKLDNKQFNIQSFGYWFSSDDWLNERLERYKTYFNNYLQKKYDKQ